MLTDIVLSKFTEPPLIIIILALISDVSIVALITEVVRSFSKVLEKHDDKNGINNESYPRSDSGVNKK